MLQGGQGVAIPQRSAHAGDELAAGQRRGEQVGRTQVERTDPLRGRRVAAIEDDGDRLRRPVLLQAAQQLQGVLGRRAQLGQDHGRLKTRYSLLALGEVVRFLDFQSGRDQLIAEPARS